LKNSRFFKNEQRKDQRVKQQIKDMLKELEKINKNRSEDDDIQLLSLIDKKLSSFEEERDLSQIWFHVDMDGTKY
jgi:vacuolar-type H+-ATPase subunit I/STV1